MLLHSCRSHDMLPLLTGATAVTHCSTAAAALAAVIEACQPGAKIVDVCEKGDSLLNE